MSDVCEEDIMEAIDAFERLGQTPERRRNNFGGSEHADGEGSGFCEV